MICEPARSEISYPGRPSRHVHTANFNVNVWREPTVEILSDTYVHTQVKAGESVTREIRIGNTGETSVPLNPEMNGRDRNVVYSGDTPDKIDRSWLSVDAPTQIASGETATVELTVSPPSSVNRGDYRGEIDLGIKDPTRQSKNGYWQRMRLRTEVWKQPSEAFEVPFSVDSNTTEVRVKITSQSAHGESQRPEVDFDVSLTSPSGDEVEPEMVRTTNKGHVSLGNGGVRDSQTVGEYGVAGGSKEFVYTVENPSSGDWSADIMPHNTMRFDYEVVRVR
ncbi:MAG: hypothetical protein SV253_07345 [Halobacteria archaeon]|nr:hypothetical protein [Halobacteria archaeon]